MVRVCDVKTALCRKEGDGNERKKLRPKRRLLNRVRDYIKEKGLWGRKCTTVLHGGVSHRTMTPRQCGNKMERKKKKTENPLMKDSGMNNN